MGRKRSNLAENSSHDTMTESSGVLTTLVCLLSSVQGCRGKKVIIVRSNVEGFRVLQSGDGTSVILATSISICYSAQKILPPSVGHCGAGALSPGNFLESPWHSMLARYAISNALLPQAIGISHKLPASNALAPWWLGAIMRAAYVAPTAG